MNLQNVLLDQYFRLLAGVLSLRPCDRLGPGAARTEIRQNDFLESSPSTDFPPAISLLICCGRQGCQGCENVSLQPQISPGALPDSDLATPGAPGRRPPPLAGFGPEQCSHHVAE